MTNINPPADSGSGRGERRRADLIGAGVELLAESGWSGLTHRAVAARAGANPGLVHYYFDGTRGLRLAVARAAAGESIGGVFEHLLTAQDEAHLVRAVAGTLAQLRQDEAASRITAELLTAAFADPDIAKVVRSEFARGRELLQQWLRAQRPGLTPAMARGTAALLVAAVDGLALHMVLDPDIRVQEIERAALRMSSCSRASSNRTEGRTT